jgi:hypothetical protein
MKDTFEELADEVDQLTDDIQQLKKREKQPSQPSTVTQQSEQEGSGPQSEQVESASTKQPQPKERSRLDHFRQDLDKGLKAVRQEEYKRARQIYQNLVMDYRSLKANNKLDKDDQERMQELHKKVDRAKID